MYIKEVQITNIKSIQEFKMSFPTSPGWHVLIGDNGSGKSSVLGAIAVALLGPDALHAYGTEVFGQSPVRHVHYEEKKKRLGHLNMLATLEKIT